MIRDEAFWVALFTFSVPLLNHFLKLGLEVGEVIAVMVPLAVFIVGLIYKNTEIEKAEIMLDIALVNAGVYEVDED